MNSISFFSSFIPAGIAPPRRGNSVSSLFPAASRVSMVAVRAAATPSKATAEAGKMQPRGITKPMPVSPALQAVVGAKEIPRSQAMKQIWAYIKDNNLQDPENKRVIICDEKLKNIFAGKDRVGFLEIAGLLSPHFINFSSVVVKAKLVSKTAEKKIKEGGGAVVLTA